MRKISFHVGVGSEWMFIISLKLDRRADKKMCVWERGGNVVYEMLLGVWER